MAKEYGGYENNSPSKSGEMNNWMDNLRAKPLPTPPPSVNKESKPHPNDQEPQYVWPDVPTKEGV